MSEGAKNMPDAHRKKSEKKKHSNKRSEKAGLPPGTPVYVGARGDEPFNVTIYEYGEREIKTVSDATLDDCFNRLSMPPDGTGIARTAWIQISGLHEVSIIEKLGKHFGIHPLTIEDILNTQQRPKIDVFDNYIFIVLRVHLCDDTEKHVVSEQIGFILGEKFLITFQECASDKFKPVVNRLITSKGRIRKSGPDYLAYALMDCVVDDYFKILENFDEEIELIEEELLAAPGTDTLHKIIALKRSLITLRKSAWPLREIINRMERDEICFVAETTHIYLRDLYDHVVQVIENMEDHREVLSGMLDVYLSSVSNRLNEVMKVLTIFATIFIPLTFITSLYGMNFEYIPELKWHWGYFTVLGFMASVAVVLLVYFKRKRWF
jgi:magnesium transporter